MFTYRISFHAVIVLCYNVLCDLFLSFSLIRVHNALRENISLKIIKSQSELYRKVKNGELERTFER